MEHRDRITAVGELELVLRGPDGRVKDCRHVDNIVTTLGLEGILDQLLEAPAVTKPKYMALGEGEVEAKAADTKLGKEISRKALSAKTRSGTTVTYKASWAAGEGTGKLTEAGLLTASSEGTLYQRTVFGLMTKEAADTLEAVWTLTLS